MGDSLVGLTISFAPGATHPDGEVPRGGFGSQVLPVAELSEEFEGAPEDGMQYLFTVRREAKLQPRVNRVENPYLRAPHKNEPPLPPSEKSKYLPSEQWKAQFLKQFGLLRERLEAVPQTPDLTSATPDQLPSARDESGWKVFVNGRKAKTARLSYQLAEDVGAIAAIDYDDIENEDMALDQAKAGALASLELDAPTAGSTVAQDDIETDRYGGGSEPHHVSASLITRIDHSTVVHLMSHFSVWFEERFQAYEEVAHYVPSTIFAPPALRKKSGTKSVTTDTKSTPRLVPQLSVNSLRPPLPTSHESKWIMSLLAKLDGLLMGEEISNLRSLAKVVTIMAESSARFAETNDVTGIRLDAAVQNANEVDAEGRAHCWMIVAIVSSTWGQGDLWNIPI